MYKLFVASNPDKTVLCIGNITENRVKKFKASETAKQKYILEAKQKILKTMACGIDSFLFVEWEEFDLLMVNILKEIDNCFGGAYKNLFPLAVVKKILDNGLPHPEDYFQVLIDREEEMIDYTDEEAADELLENVSCILCDKREPDDRIWMYVKKARDAGKKIIFI